MSEDVSLTFSNKMFLKGLDEIVKKIDTLTGHTQKSADKMSTGVSMSAASFLKINAALSMAKLGFSKLMSGIPELGRTFQIAGDIITRNLLWPLRQQLMPYLQKFLNWVRDHRAMFVRWGGVLVNVFQVVVQGIKSAINILKPFYDAAMKFFKDIFGKTSDSVDKIANMVMFKISAVMVYLEAVLKPIMTSIANIVFTIIDGVRNFVSGIAEGFMAIGGFSDELTSLMNSLQEFMQTLVGSGEGIRIFGRLIGAVVGGALKLLLLTINGIVSGLGMIIDLAKVATGATNLSTGDVMEKWMGKDTRQHVDFSKPEPSKLSGPFLSPEMINAAGGSVEKAKQTAIDQSSKVNISNLVIHANSEADGRAAGRGLHAELNRQVNQAKSQKGYR